MTADSRGRTLGARRQSTITVRRIVDAHSEIDGHSKPSASVRGAGA